jgi:hypothetical protein
MSSYRNNGAALSKKRKAEVVDLTTEEELPKPAPKKSKVVDLSLDEEVQPTQLFETTSEADLRLKIQADKVKALTWFDDQDRAKSDAESKQVWVPRLPAAAAKHFRYDPTLKDLPAGPDADYWHQSPSLKGWCKYECFFCTSYLTAPEVDDNVNYRSAIPESLARDTRVPPEFKLRTATVCEPCRTRVRAKAIANPQTHNGRGRAVWILPL